MPLSDINVDRKLTHQEVVTMLAEDAETEDAELFRTVTHWNSTLNHWKQPPGNVFMVSKVRTLAWKEESTYIFQLRENRKIKIAKQSLDGRKYGYKCATEICRLAKMPRKSQLEGLSIGDIEEISNRFVLKDTPIKCLLDAGFTLDLIVPKDFLGI